MENTKEQTVLRWVLMAFGAFIAYKMWRGMRRMFWTAFGLGWAFYWTNGGWFF